MASFYGNIKNNSRASFIFDKIYPSRLAMETALKETKDENGVVQGDGVFINRYVLINYGYSADGFYTIVPEDTINNLKIAFENNDSDAIKTINSLYYKDNDNNYVNIDVNYFNENKNNISAWYSSGTYFYEKNINFIDRWKYGSRLENEGYATNREQDQNAYKADYDLTVWMKIYSNNTERYIMVARLTIDAPAMELIIDAPADVNGGAHFDLLESSDTNYVYHVPNNWQIVLNNYSPEEEYSNEDENSFQDYWNYELDLDEDNRTYNKELKYPYLNEEGFDPTIQSKIEHINNEIIFKDTKSGRRYLDHTYKAIQLTPDTYRRNQYYYQENDKYIIAVGEFNPNKIYYIKTQSKTDNYIEQELTQDTYIRNYYYIQKEDNDYILSSGEFDPNATYYTNIAESEQIDTKRLDISLPIIGNAISDVYDTLYGQPQDDGLIGYTTESIANTYLNKDAPGEEETIYYNVNLNDPINGDSKKITEEQVNDLWHNPNDPHNIPVYSEEKNRRPYTQEQLFDAADIEPYNNIDGKEPVSVAWGLENLKQYISELRYLANGDGIIGYTSDELLGGYNENIEGHFIINEVNYELNDADLEALHLIPEDPFIIPVYRSRGLQSDWTLDMSSSFGYIYHKPKLLWKEEENIETDKEEVREDYVSLSIEDIYDGYNLFDPSALFNEPLYEYTFFKMNYNDNISGIKYITEDADILNAPGDLNDSSNLFNIVPMKYNDDNNNDNNYYYIDKNKGKTIEDNLLQYKVICYDFNKETNQKILTTEEFNNLKESKQFTANKYIQVTNKNELYFTNEEQLENYKDFIYNNFLTSYIIRQVNAPKEIYITLNEESELLKDTTLNTNNLVKIVNKTNEDETYFIDTKYQNIGSEISEDNLISCYQIVPNNSTKTFYITDEDLRNSENYSNTLNYNHLYELKLSSSDEEVQSSLYMKNTIFENEQVNNEEFIAYDVFESLDTDLNNVDTIYISENEKNNQKDFNYLLKAVDENENECYVKRTVANEVENRKQDQLDTLFYIEINYNEVIPVNLKVETRPTVRSFTEQRFYPIYQDQTFNNFYGYYSLNNADFEVKNSSVNIPYAFLQINNNNERYNIKYLDRNEITENDLSIEQTKEYCIPIEYTDENEISVKRFISISTFKKLKNDDDGGNELIEIKINEISYFSLTENEVLDYNLNQEYNGTEITDEIRNNYYLSINLRENLDDKIYFIAKNIFETNIKNKIEYFMPKVTVCRGTKQTNPYLLQQQINEYNNQLTSNDKIVEGLKDFSYRKGSVAYFLHPINEQTDYSIQIDNQNYQIIAYVIHQKDFQVDTFNYEIIKDYNIPIKLYNFHFIQNKYYFNEPLSNNDPLNNKYYLSNVDRSIEGYIDNLDELYQKYEINAINKTEILGDKNNWNNINNDTFSEADQINIIVPNSNLNNKYLKLETVKQNFYTNKLYKIYNSSIINLFNNEYYITDDLFNNCQNANYEANCYLVYKQNNTDVKIFPNDNTFYKEIIEVPNLKVRNCYISQSKFEQYLEEGTIQTIEKEGQKNIILNDNEGNTILKLWDGEISDCPINKIKLYDNDSIHTFLTRQQYDKINPKTNFDEEDYTILDRGGNLAYISKSNFDDLELNL